MAAITARSAKKRVSYHDLHNLSTVDLLFGEKKKLVFNHFSHSFQHDVSSLTHHGK